MRNAVTNLVKRLFNRNDLKTIADAIGALEGKTSGEVRVAIRQTRSRGERTLSIEELARREFAHLGMANTRERNGVLLFLLLDTRELHIFADEHIHSKVDPAIWQEVVDAMIAKFKQSQFTEGVLGAIQTVGGILTRHYPRKPDDVNELPNDVVIR